MSRSSCDGGGTAGHGATEPSGQRIGEQRGEDADGRLFGRAPSLRRRWIAHLRRLSTWGRALPALAAGVGSMWPSGVD